MLPILAILLLASSVRVDAQTQAIALGQSFVSLLNSFCHYMGGQGQDFVCTCIQAGSTQALSSSLDQFCEFMGDQSDSYKCRCVFRPGGGPPYPVAPGFEDSQRQPTLVFLQAQNGRPVFVNAPPQQGGGPIIINQQQPQPQPAPRGDDGKPIIIQLQPSPVTVLNNGNNGGGPPKIGAQSKDNPEAPAPPAAPAAPATTKAPVDPDAELVSQVFVGEGSSMITRCPVGTPVSWKYHTWMEGHIRPYYENVGIRSTLEECKQACEARDDCFFATFPASRTCFLLTTTHGDKCSYQMRGHHGKLGEACTPQRPCASAYKRCGKPNCTLQSITQIFCTTQNKLRAVKSCSAN